MNMFKNYNMPVLAAVALAMFFWVAPFAHAANLGDSVSFNVDPGYDSSARSQVSATLVKTTQNLYFYVETSWWNAQVSARQTEILADFDNLSNEFSDNIYPNLTSVFGSEWKPGVDGDNHLTLLFQSIKDNLGGYFRSSDEYIKLQSPDSNEKEMLYLPLLQIDSTQLKVFLAHEFVHMITFNQKNRLQGAAEEVWLNEARSDYASTILGYDDSYEGSNLQRRVSDFSAQPSNALTEWQNTKYDYSVENLFMHYLVDHYGINILTDSLHSKLVGIPSLNEALLKSGAKENFSQIFTDWTIALAVNDCSQDARYCYLNKNLAGLRVNSTLNFLPLAGDSSLSVTNITKNWTGNWQKVIGGSGDLTLSFSSLRGLNFQVPYIVYDKRNNYQVKFLTLDKNENGQISLKNFGTDYNSIVIIPTLQTKMSGFDGLELTYPYTFTVSIKSGAPEDDPALIQKLQDQITALKKQIAEILAKSGSTLLSPGVCRLSVDLYFGSSGAQVTCLQQFLKAQGADIYPAGLVTGTFGNLTKLAVMRFQKKYFISQTGFAGILTRAKINYLLQTDG